MPTVVGTRALERPEETKPLASAVTLKPRSFATEVQARRLLDRLFRQAGLRIVNDYFCEGAICCGGTGGITLDGWDPEKAVGYEYVDVSEAGLELREEQALASQSCVGVFLSRATDIERLERSAKQFLRERVVEIQHD